MENERLYIHTLRQSQNKGYLHLGAQIVLEATRFCISERKSRFIDYTGKLQFLQEGRVLEMVADCMGYDIDKFRKACIDELDKNFFR